MFFYLSKLFTLLFSLYPGAYFVLLFLAWRLTKDTPRRKTRRLFLAGFLLFGVLSTDLCANWILGSLENDYPLPELAELNRADGIIVLGGMMDPVAQRGTVPEFTDGANRLFAGLLLLNAEKAPAMILSGGSGLILQGGPTESALLRNWLLQQRMARPDQIIAEEESRNTAENALNSDRIASKRNWRRVFLVTSAFHMPRSVAVFDKLTDLEVIPYPTDYRSAAFFAGPEALFPSAHGIQKTWIGLKEYIGILAYWIKGYI